MYDDIRCSDACASPRLYHLSTLRIVYVAVQVGDDMLSVLSRLVPGIHSALIGRLARQHAGKNETRTNICK